MSVASAEADVKFVDEYGCAVVGYLKAQVEMAKVQKNLSSPSSGQSQVEAQRQYDEFSREQMQYRETIVRGVSTMNRLASKYGTAYVYSLTPPPMLGSSGPSVTMSVFQAIIEELPYDAEVPPQRLLDCVAQVAHGCKEGLGKELEKKANPDPIYKRAGVGIASGFKRFFSTEKEQRAIRWLIIFVLAVGLLKMVGIDVALFLKVTLLMLAKKVDLT